MSPEQIEQIRTDVARIRRLVIEPGYKPSLVIEAKLLSLLDWLLIEIIDGQFKG